jgi:hypothetical protein
MKFTNLYHIDGHLIVLKIDFSPRNPLPRILFLFQLENVLIEKLLQLFIGIINAQLFKAIFLKIFESENVQHPDEAMRGIGGNSTLVDHFYHILKQAVVYGFSD